MEGSKTSKNAMKILWSAEMSRVRRAARLPLKLRTKRTMLDCCLKTKCQGFNPANQTASSIPDEAFPTGDPWVCSSVFIQHTIPASFATHQCFGSTHFY